ncbi:alpha/beta hydrolase family protein [Kordiimonas pumila]|uniref:Alpha/beta hydrolase family protein n=1 Tax=Kordiimonas pumila TaxID=2161677 RepID=A0ABV7D3L3_9PROT|nr:hypothetical protein [Kordiimonas pumila]
MLVVMETLVLLLLVGAAVLSFLPSKRFGMWAFRVAAAAILVVVLDQLMGHGRWQMTPAAALALVLAGVTYYRAKHAPVRTTGRKLLFGGYIVVAVLWLGAACVLPKMFPMFDAPVPTGSYKVGFTSLYMKDESRPEIYTEDPNDKRELMVRVWYPSDVPEGKKPLPFLYMKEPLLGIFSSVMPAPDFIFDHLQQIPGHSYADTPLLTGDNKFPVLVFNHGMTVYGTLNSLVLENLASHGYVVFSIEHSYNASWVQFPDGRVATYKKDWMGPVSKEAQEADNKRFLQLGRGLYSDDYEVYLKDAKAFAEPQVTLNKGLDVWVDDTAFMLDELALAGSGKNAGIDQFAGRLDMDTVGIFGMSYGGATAGMFCARDDRCTAGLNMDGFQFGLNSFDIVLEKPFMIMNGDRRIDFEKTLGPELDWSKPLSFEMNDFVYRQSKSIAYSMSVGGATHGNFTDVGYTSKVGAWTGLLGPIDINTMNDIMNDYTLAFFNKYLRGMKEPLLDGGRDSHLNVVAFVMRDGSADK